MLHMPRDSQNWRQEAKCKDLPLEEVDSLFFVGRGGKSNKAKAFCSNCPVKVQCTNYALVYNEDGIWGGTTDVERSALTPMRNLLTTSRIEALGVSTVETRDYRQWGMGTYQILEERQQQRSKERQYSQVRQQPQPLTFQVQDQQLQVLVVEL